MINVDLNYPRVTEDQRFVKISLNCVRAAFAAVQESGVDTDGATDWESHFRPLKYPTWEEHVRDSVRYLRGED